MLCSVDLIISTQILDYSLDYELRPALVLLVLIVQLLAYLLYIVCCVGCLYGDVCVQLYHCISRIYTVGLCERISIKFCTARGTAPVIIYAKFDIHKLTG